MHVPLCLHGLTLHESSESTPSNTVLLSKVTVPNAEGINKSLTFKGKNSTTITYEPLLI